MAVCPFAVWKPLAENRTEPKITPTQLIRHTAVSDATSLWGYFQRSDVNTESHFYIREDGTLEQYIDTSRQADAQFDGNLHGISVETWDNRDPNNTPWTPAQLATDRKLALWLRDVHGIPLTACTGPQNPGQGYHSMFFQWSKDGHTCPNALRIGQFWKVILPGLQAKPQPTPKPSWEILDMVPAQVRDQDNRKWFFVVGDDLDVWASVNGGGFYALVPRGPDNKPRVAFTSGLNAWLEPDGTIALCGRGTDGRGWQIVFMPGSNVEPWVGLIDAHPHHIYPPA